MKIKTKLLYALGAITIGCVPIISVVSCGANSKPDPRGVLVWSGDDNIMSIYFNSKEKHVTYVINLGTESNVDKAREMLLKDLTGPNGLIIKGHPKLVKDAEAAGIKEKEVDHLPTMFTMISLGKTKNKSTQSAQTPPFIELLMECGWSKANAQKIASSPPQPPIK